MMSILSNTYTNYIDPMIEKYSTEETKEETKEIMKLQKTESEFSSIFEGPKSYFDT